MKNGLPPTIERNVEVSSAVGFFVVIFMQVIDIVQLGLVQYGNIISWGLERDLKIGVQDSE